MMRSGIYIWRNVVNGDVYVGSAVDIVKRQRDHCSTLRKGCHIYRDGKPTYLQKAWNKYGENAFEFKVVLHCDKEDLINWEQLVMDYLKATIGWDRMYNTCPVAGSALGVKRSSETKAKMSKAAKGKKKSPEHIANMSKAQMGNTNGSGNAGKEISLETRAKNSKAHKGKPSKHRGPNWEEREQEKQRRLEAMRKNYKRAKE